MDANFNLPLSLGRRKEFEVFLQAIDDRQMRGSLAEGGGDLPIGVSELVRMVEDQEFLRMSSQVASLYLRMVNGENAAEDVITAGQQLSNYMTQNYPNGFDALQNYATLTAPEVLRREVFPFAAKIDPNTFQILSTERIAESPAVYTNVALNTQAAINIAVSANVAIASHVAVAVVAVVTLGVFVSTSGGSFLRPERSVFLSK
jgi:hypothetical protein